MQLSRIYASRPDIFSPIDFHCGVNANRLNIVYGDVRRPKDRKSDSHNLGKTTLVHLIDFLMLNGVSSSHFLVKHKTRFDDFVFFAEIYLRAQEYATVRRSVSDPNRIALRKHELGNQDFATAPDEEWDHVDLSRDDAVALLDAWLDLRILKPYPYRKAITYFLRSQGDYADELQLQKFALGKDRYWKPFVAHLFGLKQGPLERKYELDDKIQETNSQLAEKQAEVRFSEDQLPELTTRISLLHAQVAETEVALDAFRFNDEERRLLESVAEGIEVRISELNERLYNIRYDLGQIGVALKQKDSFNLKETEQIFKEAQIYFPDQLRREYADLIAFNKRVTQERHAALRTRKKALEEEERSLTEEKQGLENEREQKLRILRSTDTFEKFKELQKAIAHQRAQLVYLEEQRRVLVQVADLARSVRELERERGRVVDEIKAMLDKAPSRLERFQSIFNSYCQRVLSQDGMFFFKVNTSNNLDYTIGLILPGQSGNVSSQSEGTSYKKLVCALFDLSLLKIYEDMPFFHFVYHDGVLEGLDDRRKLALLEIVREQISSGKTQYIFSMIDSDIPRDASGRRVRFQADEIILSLHDEGDSGRLFKMPPF